LPKRICDAKTHQLERKSQYFFRLLLELLFSNDRIAKNRKSGQLMVFSTSFESLTQIPPEAPANEEDCNKSSPKDKEMPNNDDTSVTRKEPEDPPAAIEKTSVSVTTENDSGIQDDHHRLQPCTREKQQSHGNPTPEENNQVLSALKGLDNKFATLARRLSEQQVRPDHPELQAKLKEIEVLANTKRDLEKRNETLGDELKKIETTFIEERQKFSAEKEKMQAEIEELKTCSADVEQALRECQEKSDLLENELLPESEEQLQQAIDKLQEYEEKLEESTQRINEYVKLVETLKAEKDKLSRDLKNEQEHLLSLTKDSQKSYQEEQEASQKKDIVIKNLEKSLATIKHDLEEQRSITAKRSQELRDAIGQLEAANDEKERLQKRLVSAMSQISEDSDIKNEKATALQAANDQNEYLQKRLKELEAQLKKSETERDEAILRLGSSDQRENELFDKLRESDRIRKEMHARLMVLIGSIRTFVRVRPTLPGELESAPVKQNGGKDVIIKEEIFQFSGNNGGSQGSKSSKYGCDDPTKNLVSVQEPWKDRGGLSQRQKKWTFGFDQVFAPQSSQADVWEATEPLVQSTVDGFNVTVFAYGQTGSGKTYTMLGNGDATPEDEGIISRAIRKLFDSKQEIEELSQGLKSVSMKVEMLEIYNENVRDLLASPTSADGSGTSLKVVGSEAVGSIRQCVTTEAEVFKILKTAEKRRCVKATNSNATSSRSHLVFSIEFTVTSKDGSVNQVGKLNVCDLAGSERVSKSGATGSILKEAQHINLSLSTLSNVIEKLQAGEKNVPFRDSKLTSLLQNSLEGNSKTLCIVCCSPLQAHFHVSAQLPQEIAFDLQFHSHNYFFIFTRKP
jgi:Kinesin motor domain